MKLSSHPYLALIAALCALPVHAAPAKTAADSAAAQQERAARAEHVEKQKKLFEDKGITVDAPVQESTPIIELPQDEADAPNTVKK